MNRPKVHVTIAEKGLHDHWLAALRNAGFDVQARLRDSRPEHRTEQGGAPGQSESQARLWISAGPGPSQGDTAGVRQRLAGGIPLVLLEPKVASGETLARSLRQTLEAADAIISTSTPGALLRALPEPQRLQRIFPFLDPAPYILAGGLREQHRAGIAGRLGLPEGAQWILCDGPMEDDGDVAAWGLVVRALARIVGLDWYLLAVGAGQRKSEVCEQTVHLPRQRVRWLTSGDAAWLAAGDIYLWPGSDRSGAASILEAQAAGVAVVACRNPDTALRVVPGASARLSAPGNVESLANDISFYLRNLPFLRSAGQAGREFILAQRDLKAAGRELGTILAPLAEPTTPMPPRSAARPN